MDERAAGIWLVHPGVYLDSQCDRRVGSAVFPSVASSSPRSMGNGRGSAGGYRWLAGFLDSDSQRFRLQPGTFSVPGGSAGGLLHSGRVDTSHAFALAGAFFPVRSCLAGSVGCDGGLFVAPALFLRVIPPLGGIVIALVQAG